MRKFSTFLPLLTYISSFLLRIMDFYYIRIGLNKILLWHKYYFLNPPNCPLILAKMAAAYQFVLHRNLGKKYKFGAISFITLFGSGTGYRCYSAPPKADCGVSALSGIPARMNLSGWPSAVECLFSN